MGDALCGPSNALQNFQKHASVDRTLQQDRFIARQSPSQGFRSQNPNEGVLDSEFATFESNLAGTPLPSIQHTGPFVTPAPRFPVSNPAEASGWAADFQKMNISGPSHSLNQIPGPSIAAMSAMSQQGWQNEFAKHQQQQQSPIQQHQPHVQGFQPSFAPHYPIHVTAVSRVQETTANQQPSAEAFDESAFEAAFEQARTDMMLQEAETTQIRAEDTGEREQAFAENTEETIKIGSDTIPQTDKNDAQARVNDADELARTAGQLLDSVKHEQSQKFRESNFLALMRRIRDREVHIEGDEFRETSQPLHPGGRYYPERQKEQQGRTIGQKARDGRITANTTHGIFKEPDSTTLTSGNSPISSSVGFNPSGDHCPYEDWNHGDRWA
ncbi:peroxin-20 [Aspergillus sclerotioniger CBS 115572]|uniref:Peroxin-20 n=1 Tax=Aspergillus sclerotioniger CBS 115572 TaxID=1450535 RepID=A0A317XA64_9EURO|nr:peroxin-20 [Aspergillus sclerotioniger CBS 115572]PWY93818.1 peroxin-20 [Aspergillus sclerotioniger CBS 115572]